MDITVKRDELFPEVQHLQTVVERKTTVPILGHVLLETIGNHILLTATDLDVSLRCRCEAQVRVAGAFTVSARKLFEIVRLAPQDSGIHIKSIAEGEWVEIGYDRSRFKVAALGRGNFPEIDEAEGPVIRMDAAMVRRMIGSCVFAISQEEGRYTLGGALAVITPSDVSLVTTDGHRLVIVRREVAMDIDQEEIRVLIPKKALVELTKLLSETSGDVEFRNGERRISFRMGRRLLISRVLSGEFPNYKMVIPQGNDLDAALDTTGFSAALRRVAVVADQGHAGRRVEPERGAGQGRLRKYERGASRRSDGDELRWTADRGRFQRGLSARFRPRRRKRTSADLAQGLGYTRVAPTAQWARCRRLAARGRLQGPIRPHAVEPLSRPVPPGRLRHTGRI